MSLKAFHVVFVAIATLLCLYFAVWAMAGYRASDDGGLLLAAIGAGVCAAALVAYEVWFLRRTREVDFL